MMSIAEILASINAWDLSAGFAVLSLTLIRPQITTCTVWDTLIHLRAWMIWYIYVYECFIIFVWIPTPAEPKSFVTNQFLMCHHAWPRTWAHDGREAKAISAAIPGWFQGCHRHGTAYGKSWCKDQHQRLAGEGGCWLQQVVFGEIPPGGCIQETVDLQHVTCTIGFSIFIYLVVGPKNDVQNNSCKNHQKALWSASIFSCWGCELQIAFAGWWGHTMIATHMHLQDNGDMIACWTQLLKDFNGFLLKHL